MKGYLLVLMVLAGIFLSSSVFGFGLLNLSSPQNFTEVGGSFMFVGAEGWNYSLVGVAGDVGNCVDLYDVGLDSRCPVVVFRTRTMPCSRVLAAKNVL